MRSYEWYLLEDKERRDMLREHGQMAREYPDVRANTIASFALNDYEWVLAFEADELHRIVDLMRELRASRARLHVREEVPFHTGRRVEVGAPGLPARPPPGAATRQQPPRQAHDPAPRRVGVHRPPGVGIPPHRATGPTRWAA